MTGGYTSNPSLTFFDSVEIYTPAVPAGTVPVLNALPSLLQRRATALTLTGSGLTGATGTSAPQLQLQRVENGLIYPVSPVSYSATTFTSAAIPTLPAGLYMARIVVDGVPSAARLVRFTDPAGNPVATACGLATLKEIRKPGFFDTLRAKTATLVAGLQAAASAEGVTLSADGEGGMFGFFLLPQLPQNYSQVMQSDAARFGRLFHGLLERGVYIAPALYEAGFVSAAHGEDDVAQTVAAAREVFETL